METINFTSPETLAKLKVLLKYSACGAAATWYLKRYVWPVVLRQLRKQQTINKKQVPETGRTGFNQSEIDASDVLKNGKLKKMKIVDENFPAKLMALLKIMIPGAFSKEAGILLMHSSILVCRTFLSIYVAQLEGLMIKAIVQKNFRHFLLLLSKWLLVALPATFVNSMIRFFESCLGLAFKKQLINYAYSLYFTNQTYYRVSNLDSRLTNADQCLTEDITEFCDKVAHLYSSLTKPILDVVLIFGTLYREAIERQGNAHFSGPLAGLVICLTAKLLKIASPKFGDLVAERARLKGHLRSLHSRIITNAEEIAFYGGHKIEHRQIKVAFKKLYSQMMLIYRKRILYITMEQFLMKYVWSATGMVMLAIPTLTAKYANRQRTVLLSEEIDGGVSERTRSFTTNTKMLSSGADAVERLMSSYKEIAELAGYTARVHEMLEVFSDVANGKYVRSTVAIGAETATNRSGDAKWDVMKIEGHIAESIDDVIKIEEIPIITPTGDIIVKNFSLEVPRGCHVLITGPNGCGKSSLFRIVSGLWPLYRGTISIPRNFRLFYLPQRPYMTVGALRDQVIYPDSIEEMTEKGHSDIDLEEIMCIVHLDYLVSREGGWDAVGDWSDMLSGGEKQRIGLARIFYHRPQFALLDECTSAVSIDVEAKIYHAAKDAGITLLTVTHRPSLWKFHDVLLQFDGEGNWRLESLTDSTSLSDRLSLIEEKHQLENQLAFVPKAKDRLREVCRMLGTSSAFLQERLLEALEEQPDEQRIIPGSD